MKNGLVNSPITDKCGETLFSEDNLKNLKVGVVSLGCDKNRVDSEKMLAEIGKHFKITTDAESCDVLIINSCAFLESSRKEAIDTIFEYAALKEGGQLKKLIVTGCLPQKFIGEIFDELVEVDAFLGTFDYSKIVEVICKLFSEGKRLNYVGCGAELATDRILTTPLHYAYLKIADGCSNHCTYCLIPKIRGGFRSYPIEDLLFEAKKLGKLKELILVAQDITRYGEDGGKNRLIELINRLSELDNIDSIRLLYCYPEKITDELIDLFKTNKKLIHYIDVPLQHADDRILKLMNRKGTFDGYIELIDKLKAAVPDIAVRSTFITGFPSETEEEHQRLIEFIKRAKLFNAGFFAYSREEGTPAYLLPNQINKETKKRRLRELYAAQRAVVEENLTKLVGSTITVTAEAIDYKKNRFYGRAYFNAPDVDGVVYISSSELIKQGESYCVEITQNKGYDLYGEVKK